MGPHPCFKNQMGKHRAPSSPTSFFEFLSLLLPPLDSSPQIINARALSLTQMWEQQSLELGAWNLDPPAPMPHFPGTLEPATPGEVSK